MATKNTITFQKLYHEVKTEMKRQGIDPAWAPIMTGHGMIESSWGQSANAELNNYWGMKAISTQKGQTLATTEGYGKNAKRIKDKFLSFNDLKSGVRAAVKRMNEKFGAFNGIPSDSQYVKNLNSKFTYFTGDPELFYKNLHSIVNGKTAQEAIKLEKTQQTLDIPNVKPGKIIERPDATSVENGIIPNFYYTYYAGMLPEVTVTASRKLGKGGLIIDENQPEFGYWPNPEIASTRTQNKLQTKAWKRIDEAAKNDAFCKIREMYYSWLHNGQNEKEK